MAQVKIARKMVANRWTTCVLPFSLNRQQVDAIFGPAYSATAKDGTQILYFDHIEGNKAYFVRHAYNTIVAGKPFLIKPTKEVTSINTADVKAIHTLPSKMLNRQNGVRVMDMFGHQVTTP